MSHPKPEILAPVVGNPTTVEEVRKEMGRGIGALHEKVDQTISALRGDLAAEQKRAIESLRSDISRAHAKLKVLEVRWHERVFRKVASWLSR